MTDYQKYINALRKCAKEHKNDKTPLAHIRVSDLCHDVANLLERLEQEPKTGHWIVSPNDCFVHCSDCGLHGDIGIYKHYGWCPNCGAKMEDSE